MHPCMTILGCAELGRAFPSEGHFRTKGDCHGECQGLGSLWAKLGDIKSCWKLSDQKKHSGIENGSNHSNHSTLQPAVFPSSGETMIVQRDVFLEMQMSQKSNSRVVPLGESSDVGSSMALLAVREETAGRSKALLRFQQTNIGFTRALSPITQYHGRYLFCFWFVSYLLTWKSTVVPCVDCWVDLHRSGNLARESFGSPWLWARGARGRDEFTEPIQTSDALPGVMTCDVMTHGMWSHLTHWPMDWGWPCMSVPGRCLVGSGWNRCGGCVRTSCLCFMDGIKSFFFQGCWGRSPDSTRKCPKIAQFYRFTFKVPEVVAWNKAQETLLT